MNRVSRHIKSVIPYLVVLITVGGIIYLTAMKLESTMKLSELFRSILIEVYDKWGIDTTNEWWNSSTNIRLLGHIIEYLVLGLVVGLVVKHKIIALLICVFVSLTDQIVKIYVPARHFDKGDIPFDLVGFCSGLAIAWVLKFAVKKIRETELNEGE